MQEAARIGYTDLNWHKAYVSGKRQMETNFERAAAMTARIVNIAIDGGETM
jgi:anthraniloyl-CoA monooxygenase